jgi:hypothetical protein
MTLKTSLLVGVAAGVALVGGCQSTNSENVKTAGMAATFRTTDALSGNVAAHAQFKIGSSYIDLSGGDALYCDGIKLGKSEGAFNEINYDATVPRRTPGDVYVFEFVRPATGEDHASYAIAPEPVVITAPSNGTLATSAVPLVVRWAVATQGGISISVTGPDVTTHRYSVGTALGTFTIPGGDLACAANLTACTRTLTVTRTVVGSGDPDFESASVESITASSVDIQIQM